MTQNEHVYAAGSALTEDVCSGWVTITCLAFESLQVILYTSYKALGKCLFCGQQMQVTVFLLVVIECLVFNCYGGSMRNVNETF